MHRFSYKKNNLYCEGCKVEDLAKKFGTPLYVYSQKTILDHFFKIQKAFASIKPLICYSVKANSNLSILRLLIQNGAGLDIVSGGELYRAKKAKCPSKRIVYASVGKTKDEIREAIKSGILMFNVESVPELKRINMVAALLKKRVNVALRLNPDVEPQTHNYVATGKAKSKFGMDIRTLKSTILSQKAYSNVNIIGIHIHIGSQVTVPEPFIKAIRKVKSLIKELKKENIQIKYFNIGGGLGIVYDKEQPQTAKEFASKVLPLLKDLSCKIILEPGRFIVGNAGILVTNVTYIKDSPQRRFVIVDAAMNDLIRPALYGSYQKIVPLKEMRKRKPHTVKTSDIVGPICESADFLGKRRYLDVGEGEYIAVLGSGAYSFSMSSNYNSRPRAAEVLVKGKQASLIRKRETYRDLVDKETNI